MTAPRTPTPIDGIANDYFAATLEASPMLMTQLGVTRRQDEYDDLSTRGLEEQAGRDRAALRRLDGAEPVDDVDRVTLAAMRERLGLAVQLHDAGYDRLSLNGIASGLHAIREVYDLMPTQTAADWEVITRRLRAVPAAIDGWFATQEAAIRDGLLPASRQVDLLAEQCDGWTGPGGFFAELPARAASGPALLSGPALSDLSQAVHLAADAYRASAARLRATIRPSATEQDAVGRERYRLYSQEFLGSRVDVDETYAWGLAEVARLEAEEQQLASRIRPGAGVAEVKAALDADPRYQLHGVDALQQWMQQRADEAIAALNGRHFDIPEPARRIECLIAPTHDGGIYYTDPSDDWVRPGRMWWSVPAGEDTFGTWRELTTVYHEGVPGHHLQISQALWRADQLNSWRRQGCWVSGHGEGWALYAEQLMAELGFQDDPGNRLGQLDSEAVRAVRVVIDMGLHNQLPAPAEVGGGEWTFDKAWRYFNAHVSSSPGVARFEVLRYFGWPGQAPAYKIGQRRWLDLREQVRKAQGSAFDLKEFHRTALDVGSVGLDVLSDAVQASLG